MINWNWEKLQGKRQGHGPAGPNFTQISEQLNKLKNIKLPGGGKIIIPVVLALWLATGIYVVNPDEMGVVQRFGAYHRMTGPGPHFHLPFPFETVQTPRVTHVRRAEIGYRSVPTLAGMPPQSRPVPEESEMLTGDDSIVHVQFIVQYMLKDPVKYLFNLTTPDVSVKNAAEAAMREIIGYKQLDAILTYGKPAIQDETHALLQTIMNRYESGIRILAVQLQDVQPPEPVIDAFRDVVRAMEDAVRITTQAEAYRNDIIPRARGEAAVIVNQAEAHKEAVVSRAKGQSHRFLSILAEYKQAPEVTRQRLYLEAMEAILRSPGVTKTIISDEALRRVLPYLPLERIPPRPPQLSDVPQAAQTAQAAQPLAAPGQTIAREGRIP